MTVASSPCPACGGARRVRVDPFNALYATFADCGACASDHDPDPEEIPTMPTAPAITKPTIVWETEATTVHARQRLVAIPYRNGFRLVLEEAEDADAMGALRWDGVSPETICASGSDALARAMLAAVAPAPEAPVVTELERLTAAYVEALFAEAREVARGRDPKGGDTVDIRARWALEDHVRELVAADLAATERPPVPLGEIEPIASLAAAADADALDEMVAADAKGAA